MWAGNEYDRMMRFHISTATDRKITVDQFLDCSACFLVCLFYFVYIHIFAICEAFINFSLPYSSILEPGDLI